MGQNFSTKMRAWYFDKSCSNPREKLGLKILTFDANNFDNDKSYKEFKEENNYDYQDIITINGKTLQNYEEKVKQFLREHIHDDDEARAIVDGCGYFDVKDSQDVWIRIEVTKGDLLVLPAGIYHRFIPDQADFIKAIRLFQGHPVWTPINRDEKEQEIEKNKVRKNYLQMLNT